MPTPGSFISSKFHSQNDHTFKPDKLDSYTNRGVAHGWSFGRRFAAQIETRG